MGTTVELMDNSQHEVELYYSHKQKGYGQWNIEIEATLDSGEKKTFKEHITDAPFIDEIQDMKADDASWDEIQQRYHDYIFYRLESKMAIEDWIEEIKEEEEN